MAPKKAAGAAPKKAATSPPSHASYQDMIKESILNLKERNGSSRQAIKKYIFANNNLGNTTDAQFSSQINRALITGAEKGLFDRPKGASGPVKLKKPGTKTAAPKSSSPVATKAAPKTATKAKTTKKATGAAAKSAPAKKAAPKKTATKATTAKKSAAAKPKANVSKVRKTPAAAPAVVDKPPVVLGKTKSGRVTKSTAPTPIAKKSPVKKSAKAKAAPKKKSTPKKAAA
ncbi:hypothetical protein LTR66_009755 [Elasticomyces elasticus]|nr:hypothetical protein LTR66_009755 [Elasticomyces elasticus]KAK5005651.1 hypothetical protein LTR28_007450 [Elasticomyces elasticus]